MSLLNVLTHVTKAVVGVAASPIAVVADICMLPDSALNNRPAFDYTGRVLVSAGKAIMKAVEPEDAK